MNFPKDLPMSIKILNKISIKWGKIGSQCRIIVFSTRIWVLEVTIWVILWWVLKEEPLGKISQWFITQTSFKHTMLNLCHNKYILSTLILILRLIKFLKNFNKDKECSLSYHFNKFQFKFREVSLSMSLNTSFPVRLQQKIVWIWASLLRSRR